MRPRKEARTGSVGVPCIPHPCRRGTRRRHLLRLDRARAASGAGAGRGPRGSPSGPGPGCRSAFPARHGPAGPAAARATPHALRRTANVGQRIVEPTSSSRAAFDSIERLVGRGIFVVGGGRVRVDHDAPTRDLRTPLRRRASTRRRRRRGSTTLRPRRLPRVVCGAIREDGRTFMRVRVCERAGSYREVLPRSQRSFINTHAKLNRPFKNRNAPYWGIQTANLVPR
jgi:hypothetical protein